MISARHGDDAARLDRPHLLVVDDDARLRSLLARFLTREGYLVSTAASAAEARDRLEVFVYDLIVLDVMMPGETGLAFAAALRGSGAPQALAPILMLTARAGAPERIEGLEAGVDDYLSKPFEPRELALRIAAILRRAGAAQKTTDQAIFGPFAYDIARQELRRAGAPVALTDRERAMLTVLARARGAPVARAALSGPEMSERAIDVQIARLRRKLAPDAGAAIYLQTARGIGYRLAIED